MTAKEHEVQPLTADTLSRYAERLRLRLNDEERTCYVELANEILTLLGDLGQTEASPGADAGPERDPGRRPSSAEDPLNAVIRRVSVKAPAPTGSRLAGLRIGVKDSISIRGIPMTAASSVMDGYVPRQDSIVVQRLLADGAEIVATLNMDGFAWSGGADTGDFGPIRNPVDPSRSASGSSGGTAAALAYHWVDATLGADQAGSNRLPASWCGVLGLKPTYSLVPYTGILSIDPSIDHVGPMARDVRTLAALLDVIAGKDESDPRQRTVEKQDYLEAVSSKSTLQDLRVGLVVEALSARIGVTEEVRQAMLSVARTMTQMGAQVEDVSIPEHLLAAPIAFGIYCEGTLHQLETGGAGYGHSGPYDAHLAGELGRRVRERADDLPPTVKAAIIAGSMVRDQCPQIYARAQNLRARIRDAYDRALRRFDVLLMPTTPTTAFKHDDALDLGARVRRGWGMLVNTPPTDLSGHPALSMPAAHIDGLPLGIMSVARHFDDARLLQVAHAWEQQEGWYPQAF